jgi:DNA-directed RNA polymerase subunit RPC12/RpoP
MFECGFVYQRVEAGEMKTKYFCLNCGHAFDVVDKSDFDKLGACPKCTSDNYLEDDIDIADALRDWLNPWHPASEPPEANKELLLIINNKFYATGKYDERLSGNWLVDGWGRMDDITHWRDLPPIPEVKT